MAMVVYHCSMFPIVKRNAMTLIDTKKVHIAFFFSKRLEDSSSVYTLSDRRIYYRGHYKIFDLLETFHRQWHEVQAQCITDEDVFLAIHLRLKREGFSLLNLKHRYKYCKKNPNDLETKQLKPKLRL